MTSSPTFSVHLVLDALPERRPVVVALDGPSGGGKSTLAAALVREADAACVSLDDFYTTRIPDADLHALPPVGKLALMLEWDRARSSLATLRTGGPAEWRAFDYLAGVGDDGRWRSRADPTRAEPRPVIVLDGWGSTAGPLDDLIDVRVLVTADPATRRRRRSDRGDDAYGSVADWDRDNAAIEAWLFTEHCPPGGFDLVIG